MDVPRQQIWTWANTNCWRQSHADLYLTGGAKVQEGRVCATGLLLSHRQQFVANRTSGTVIPPHPLLFPILCRSWGSVCVCVSQWFSSQIPNQVNIFHMHVYYMHPFTRPRGAHARGGQEKKSVCMWMFNVHLKRGSSCLKKICSSNCLPICGK